MDTRDEHNPPRRNPITVPALIERLAAEGGLFLLVWQDDDTYRPLSTNPTIEMAAITDPPRTNTPYE
jgi:hypothetical protein